MLKSATCGLSGEKRNMQFFCQDVTKAIFLRITHGEMFLGIPN